MLLWILMAVMTALASLAVLAPLGRGSAGIGGHAGSIYRDQLRELARDRERGLIGADESEAARIELSRRLLRSDGEAAPADGDGRRAAVIGFAVAAVAIPVLALGTYLTIGSPSLPDQPFSTRTDAATGRADVAALIGKVEQHLHDDPEDGSGWELLAPIYAKLGRYDDAVRAYGNANRILGPTADREALLGEAIAGLNRGLVTADARAAFDRALKLDPKNERAGFYRAVAITQSGNRDAAIAAWQALVDDAPAGAPWLAAARDELERIRNPDAGPSAADMATAADKTPQEQQAMIEGMVSGLAGRLDANPRDAEGWARLFRAYMVLGKRDDAEAALGRAQKALAGDAALLAAVRKAAAENGIGANGTAP